MGAIMAIESLTDKERQERLSKMFPDGNVPEDYGDLSDEQAAEAAQLLFDIGLVEARERVALARGQSQGDEVEENIEP
jgi:hypothetical protein